MADTRSEIEQTVNRNPGISFTELKEITGYANGVLQYHINRSSKLRKEKGAIVTEKICVNCEMCEKCEDRCLKKVIRKGRNQKILQMKKNGKKNSEVASELDLAKSTVSYHVSKLRDLGLLDT